MSDIVSNLKDQNPKIPGIRKQHRFMKALICVKLQAESQCWSINLGVFAMSSMFEYPLIIPTERRK